MSEQMLRDALDHIARTCANSRSQTRRIRWIGYRARHALDGVPFDPHDCKLPARTAQSIERNTVEKIKLTYQVEELQELLLDVLERCTLPAELETQISKALSKPPGA